jgi:hypothetical protein
MTDQFWLYLEWGIRCGQKGYCCSSGSVSWGSASAGSKCPKVHLILYSRNSSSGNVILIKFITGSINDFTDASSTSVQGRITHSVKVDISLFLSFAIFCILSMLSIDLLDKDPKFYFPGSAWPLREFLKCNI